MYGDGKTSGAGRSQVRFLPSAVVSYRVVHGHRSDRVCAGSLLGEEVIGSIGFKVCEGHQAMCWYIVAWAGHVDSGGGVPFGAFGCFRRAAASMLMPVRHGVCGFVISLSWFVHVLKGGLEVELEMLADALRTAGFQEEEEECIKWAPDSLIGKEYYSKET